MIRQSIAEVQRETREPVDDCPLCEDMRLTGGYRVVYQGNLLAEKTGHARAHLISTTFPRRSVVYLILGITDSRKGGVAT